MTLLLPSLLARLPQWSLVAAVEILILAFVIYQILLMVKATGAIQLLLWIALLAALYYGAEWAGFETVQWLLGNLFPYLVFAMIVLFQAEIRRGLARFGRNPFRTRYSALEARQVFEEILLAVSRLASQKIGALIVLERDTTLRTYTESGIPLQARLSYDLLVTIFQPRAPLHDGAVILRKDKIVAAACFLPLSMNPIWGTQLGTRHRAAVGITEETDAVSIVVSEETGLLSLAVGGAIELGLSPERLAQRLGEIFGHPLPSASPAPARNPAWEESQPNAATGSMTTRDPL